MAYKNILSRCDLLPGGYVLLSKYQEEGIYHLEDWHSTQTQKMMNLIHPRYFKPDCKEQRGRSDGPQPTDPNHHTPSHHYDNIEKRQNLNHTEGVNIYSNENGQDGIPLPTDHNHHTPSHHTEEVQSLSHIGGVNTYFNKNGQDSNSFANDQHNGQIIESAYSTNTPPNTQNNQNIHRDHNDGDDDGNDGDEEDYDSDDSIFSDGDDINNNEHDDEDSDSDDEEKDDEKEKGEDDGEDDGEETSDGETSDDESEFEDNNDDRMANLCIPGTDNIFLYQDMDVTQTEDNTVHNIVNVLNVNSERKTETVDMVERRDEVVGEQCGESTSSPLSSPIISFVFTEFINVKYRIYRQKVIKHPEIFGQFAVCVSLTMFVGFLFNIIKRH